MLSKRSVETPRLIMITTYMTMIYHEYQGMFEVRWHNKVYVYCRQINYLSFKV